MLDSYHFSTNFHIFFMPVLNFITALVASPALLSTNSSASIKFYNDDRLDSGCYDKYEEATEAIVRFFSIHWKNITVQILLHQ